MLSENPGIQNWRHTLSLYYRQTFVSEIFMLCFSCLVECRGGLWGALPALFRPSGPVEFNPPVLSRWRQAPPMAETPQSFPLAPAAHVQRWCRAAEYAELQAALNWGEWFWSLARQILRWHMPTPDVERGWLRLLHRKGTCYWNGAVADSIWISP